MLAIIGATGSGKTMLQRLLMQSVLPSIRQGSRQRALIYDAKQDFLSLLAGMEITAPVHVLNPLGDRAVAWDMASDVTSPAAALQAASLLIPKAAHGTRQMAVLLDHCHRSRATLILCGDARQLQSIKAGGIFHELSQRFGSATLQEIKRQYEPWTREAIKAFAEGRAAHALKEFAGRGLVSLSEEPIDAMNQLLVAWKPGHMASPHSAIILANRNADVQTINEMVQQERLRAGLLSGPTITIEGLELFIGDRIMFTKNARALHVCNGDMATITAITGNSVTAELDSKTSTVFSPVHYPHVQLGYALTTHKAQGVTVERSFIYVDQTVENRETACVQASRARGLCSFYAAAENLEELAPSMSRSRPKILATNLLPENVHEFSHELTLTL